MIIKMTNIIMKSKSFRIGEPAFFVRRRGGLEVRLDAMARDRAVRGSLVIGALLLGWADPAWSDSQLCVLGPVPDAPPLEDLPQANLHCTCTEDTQLFMNSDRQYEVAFAWPTDGSSASEVGAFAERYETPDGRAGSVCKMILHTTDDGRQIPVAADLYVWSDVDGGPGVVLGLIPGQRLGPAPTWPNVGVREMEVYELLVIGVEGAFWAGARFFGQEAQCSVYVGGDMTGDVPGIVRNGRTLVPEGESTQGWTGFEALWDQPVALGIGVIIGWCPVPVEEGSWGEIKLLYR